MTKAKAEAGSRLPIRRGLSEAEAAVYIGIGITKFRELVSEGQMPRPRLIGSRRIWDVLDLDAAFNSLPHDEAGYNPAAVINPWHR